MNQKELTIAIHTPGNDEYDILELTAQEQQGDVNFNEDELEQLASQNQIKEVLKNVFNDLRAIQTESKFSGIRQQSYNEEVKKNERYNFYMIILESIIFLIVCFAQLYYVKYILENKRMI